MNPGRSRPTDNQAFTVIEVLLAIIIASFLLFVALHFYQQIARFRDDLLKESQKIADARLVLDRLTSELRTSAIHPGLNIGLKGNSNWIEFLIATYPGQTAWITPAEGETPPPPDAGYRLVRYNLRQGNSPQTGKVVEDFTNTTTANETPAALSSLPPATDGIGATNLLPLAIGIERSEKRLLTRLPTTSTNTIDLSEGMVLISKHLKRLEFRYHNSTGWQSSWAGPTLPMGIEVTVNDEPPVLTNLLESVTNHVFRRIIHIPVSSPASTISPDNTPEAVAP